MVIHDTFFGLSQAMGQCDGQQSEGSERSVREGLLPLGLLGRRHVRKPDADTTTRAAPRRDGPQLLGQAQRNNETIVATTVLTTTLVEAGGLIWFFQKAV